MRDRLGYVVVALVLGPILAKTSIPYRWLAWPGAGLYLSGAVLAFASGVLRHRQSPDYADAAYYTGVLLMKLGELTAWLLLAMAVLRLFVFH